MSNALKYSSDVSMVKVNSKMVDNNFIISITDHGIGINQEDQGKIFQKFYRIEGKDENRFPGFGVGLFIIAEIIKQHEGEIGVIIEPEKGSVFYFHLACS